MARTVSRAGFVSAAVLASILSVAVGSHIATAEMTKLEASERALLGSQVKDKYNCDLEEVMYAREVEVGGEKTLEGRIRCVDQREVDFSQPSGHQGFELNLCQPAVC